jgi:hypothetical protein
MKGSKEFQFLVAIETDPARMSGEADGAEMILGQGDADQMLAHLAADLATLLGGIGKCHLAAAGALLDQCQLLRPGLPAFAALSGQIRHCQDQAITPGLTATGATNGLMSAEALQPDESLPPSILKLLPMVAAGPDGLVDELAEEMEHRFLAEGQVSAHTASWLEAAFGIAINHARFMTLTDLNAMFRMQMEHFGYLPLWELIDAAIEGRRELLALTTDHSTRYEWIDGHVQVSFQTFDYWASRGGGRDVSDVNELPGGYVAWSRELRRYTSTLAAHAVPLKFELPDGCKGEVSESYLFETAPGPGNSESLASITEHSSTELGTIAISAIAPGTLRNFYPLAPQGLNLIHDLLQTMELEGEGMAFPGTIKFSETGRSLRPVRLDA